MTVRNDTQAIEADACAIAHIPAPSGCEAGRVAWLEERLAAAPGTRWRDEVGNLVWALGDAPYDVGLFVHVDTVFGADTEHGVVERAGWLCGPSVGDNSLAVAVTAHVVERLAGGLSRSLAVVFTVGEEGLGGLHGARHACAELDVRQLIALEGHGVETVYADAVGSLRARLAVTGPGGHSWWDRGRASANHALAGLLAGVLQWESQVSLNIGRIAGGEAVNAIAAHAEADIEGRCLEEAPLSALETWLERIEPERGLDLRVQVLDRRPAGRLSRDDPLVGAVRAERARLGLPDRLGNGSTDANAAHAAGIPALGLGCARGVDMHTPDERVARDSIALGVAQLEGVLRRLLTEGDPPVTDKDARRSGTSTAKGER